jgi:hypothetical protein
MKTSKKAKPSAKTQFRYLYRCTKCGISTWYLYETGHGGFSDRCQRWDGVMRKNDPEGKKCLGKLVLMQKEERGKDPLPPWEGDKP